MDVGAESRPGSPQPTKANLVSGQRWRWTLWCRCFGSSCSFAGALKVVG